MVERPSTSGAVHKAAGTAVASHHGPEGLAGPLEKRRLSTSDCLWMHELSSRHQPPLCARCGEVDVELCEVVLAGKTSQGGWRGLQLGGYLGKPVQSAVNADSTSVIIAVLFGKNYKPSTTRVTLS